MYRQPTADDGPAISALVQECPPLDVNSPYCNLLQCTHFAATCVVAEAAGALAGWLSAYRPPAAPDEIFVWQVAVRSEARGLGLGGRMVERLLERQAVQGVTRLTTTITLANLASWTLFSSIARNRGVQLTQRLMFDRDRHFEGAHDSEFIVSIDLCGAPRLSATKEAS